MLRISDMALKYKHKMPLKIISERLVEIKRKEEHQSY